MSAIQKSDSTYQHLQSSLQEIEELKELCCYLHDERAKLINLVTEWKKFGKHIFGTMQVQKDTYIKEISNLELQERDLLGELNQMKEIMGNISGNIESVRKGGDGSSSPSPTNISLNKTETKREDIYMSSKDVVSSPSSLNSVKPGTKQFHPYFENTNPKFINEYESINSINAYDIKKFHHSMPRQRLTSNSTAHSSYGSDDTSVNLRQQQNSRFINQSNNDIKYKPLNPKYQPTSGSGSLNYQPNLINNSIYQPTKQNQISNYNGVQYQPKYQPYSAMYPGQQFNNDSAYHPNVRYQEKGENNYAVLPGNANKYQPAPLSDEDRAMYRNMCKSVWKNLGKSTTYKTAV